MKVFISSTCKDLSEVRSNLCEYLKQFSYTPILSEIIGTIGQEGFIASPTMSTEENCINGVKKSDIVIHLIGKYWGNRISSKTFSQLRVTDRDESNQKQKGFLEDFANEDISITQAEILSALENDIPVFCFIDKDILTNLKQLGKLKEDKKKQQISIWNGEDDGYQNNFVQNIFNWVNYMGARQKGTWRFEYNTATEIKNIFIKQSIFFYKSLLDDRKKRKIDNVSTNSVSALILKSESAERENIFTDLYRSNVDGNDQIIVMGTGVTHFLLDEARVNDFLEKGNHIRVLLLRDEIIRKEDIDLCELEQYIKREMIEDEIIRKEDIDLCGLEQYIKRKIIEKCTDKQCPLKKLNILIRQKHFLGYFGKGVTKSSKKTAREESYYYVERMEDAYRKCKFYQQKIRDNSWTGTFELKHFYSFIPMSMTAIASNDTNNKNMVIEFVIPFTDNRIILKSSVNENQFIYDTFIRFFEDTWIKSKKNRSGSARKSKSKK
ncbi:MAG: DUF4062 domain-containing protein [Prevotellaceae bacterium]|jgi:hypothetical protein|nr:DUF4062 domain-containing protein [Prevotellaceae bacterium]